MAEEEDTLGPASAATVALEPQSHRTRPNNSSLRQLQQHEDSISSSLNFGDQASSQHPRVQTAIIGSTNCDSCARGSIDDSHDSCCRTDLQLSQQQHQSTVDQQQQQLCGFFDDRSSWFSLNRPYHSRRKGRRKAVASEATATDNRRRRCSPSWSSWSVLTQKDILLAFILFLSTLHLSW